MAEEHELTLRINIHIIFKKRFSSRKNREKEEKELCRLRQRREFGQIPRRVPLSSKSRNHYESVTQRRLLRSSLKRSQLNPKSFNSNQCSGNHFFTYLVLADILSCEQSFRVKL